MRRLLFSGLCLCGTLCLQAEVVARVPHSFTALLEKHGGRVVRRSAAVINGGRGRVLVYSLPVGSAQIARQLGEGLQQPPDDNMPHNGTFVLELPRGRRGLRERAVILPADGRGSLTILLETDFEKTHLEPLWPWNDVPAVPALKLELTMLLEQGGTGLVIGTFDLSGDQIYQVLRSTLAAAGWQCVTPAAEQLGSVIYSRAEEILLTTVQHGRMGEGRVAILRYRPR